MYVRYEFKAGVKVVHQIHTVKYSPLLENSGSQKKEEGLDKERQEQTRL